MSSDRVREMTAHQQDWEIPQAKITELTAARTAALVAYNADKSPERNGITAQTCKDAFTAFRTLMKSIKKHYFIVPPLTLTDLVTLGLKPPDTVKTEVKQPIDQAGVEVIKWAPHTLGLRPFMQADMGGEAESNYGILVLYAPVLPGGSSELVAKRIGDTFFLTAPPRSATDLPNNFFTRKQHYDLILPPEASGLPCYLATQYENEKGDKVPPGSLTEVIVP